MSDNEITVEARLNVQSNVNTYAADVELESELEPLGVRFYYRTTTGQRSPHLQAYVVKWARNGKKRNYHFGFILLDYPIHSSEKLTLGCIFTLPPSKQRRRRR